MPSLASVGSLDHLRCIERSIGRSERRGSQGDDAVGVGDIGDDVPVEVGGGSGSCGGGGWESPSRPRRNGCKACRR